MVEDNGKKALSLLYTIVTITFTVAFILGFIIGRFIW